MKRLLSPVLLLALAFSVLVSGNAAAEARRVIVFGDSITAGSQLPPADKPRVWVNLVQERSQGQLQMINEGKGGRPTASLPEFQAMLARQPKADLLVLALGTNDSRDISETCVPKAVANLRSMAELARKTYGPGLPILIVAPTNLRKDTLGPTKPIADQRDAKLRELGAAYEALARELHADFLSFYGVVPPESLTKDGVHPDAAGNDPMAKAILPKLLAPAH